MTAWVPPGYEGYTRILFPFLDLEKPQDDDRLAQRFVTWNQMAVRSGRVPHRLMEAEGVVTEALREQIGALPFQHLALRQEIELSAILATQTSSSTGRFLLWDGAYRGSLELPSSSIVNFHDTTYCAFQGPIEAWRDFWRYPNWSWPDDRAWCLHVNVDPDLTNYAYLAGTEECIQQIFDNPVIEAIRALPDDPFTGTDSINLDPPAR